MASMFRSAGKNRPLGVGLGTTALPPAMTPRELAMVEAYFGRSSIVASLRALIAAVREAPPRYRGKV